MAPSSCSFAEGMREPSAFLWGGDMRALRGGGGSVGFMVVLRGERGNGAVGSIFCATGELRREPSMPSARCAQEWRYLRHKRRGGGERGMAPSAPSGLLEEDGARAPSARRHQGGLSARSARCAEELRREPSMPSARCAQEWRYLRHARRGEEGEGEWRHRSHSRRGRDGARAPCAPSARCAEEGARAPSVDCFPVEFLYFKLPCRSWDDLDSA